MFRKILSFAVIGIAIALTGLYVSGSQNADALTLTHVDSSFDPAWPSRIPTVLNADLDSIASGVAATVGCTGASGVSCTSNGSITNPVLTIGINPASSITAASFIGAGTGLTGTAASLTAASATVAASVSGGTVSATTGLFSGLVTAQSGVSVTGPMISSSISAASGVLVTGAGAPNDAADGARLVYATGTAWVGGGAADGVCAGNGGLSASGVPATSLGCFSSAGILTPASGVGLASAHIADSVTAPAIASGFGTTPSIVASNGTAAFTINVGTGGSASSGVVTMPASTTGWACEVLPNAAPQAAAMMYSVPTSSTSITITNYTLTTGSSLAWTSGEVIVIKCRGY